MRSGIETNPSPHQTCRIAHVALRNDITRLIYRTSAHTKPATSPKSVQNQRHSTHQTCQTTLLSVLILPLRAVRVVTQNPHQTCQQHSPPTLREPQGIGGMTRRRRESFAPFRMTRSNTRAEGRRCRQDSGVSGRGRRDARATTGHRQDCLCHHQRENGGQRPPPRKRSQDGG